jgi:F420-0:gamma-glutamyl ligase
MLITSVKTRLFATGENLVDFIAEHLTELKEKSILAVTSKIVALSEGRVLELTSPTAKDEIILQESELAVRTPWAWLTLKDVEQGMCVLLPKDSYAAAAELRDALCRRYDIKNLGLLITDSRTLPLRRGTVGVALGYSGFLGLKDYVGKPDLYGKPFKMTRVDLADSLAAAAVSVMGEGRECQPLAVITDPPVAWHAGSTNSDELAIPIQDDLYAPLYAHLLEKEENSETDHTKIQ